MIGTRIGKIPACAGMTTEPIDNVFKKIPACAGMTLEKLG